MVAPSALHNSGDSQQTNSSQGDQMCSMTSPAVFLKPGILWLSISVQCCKGHQHNKMPTYPVPHTSSKSMFTLKANSPTSKRKTLHTILAAAGVEPPSPSGLSAQQCRAPCKNDGFSRPPTARLTARLPHTHAPPGGWGKPPSPSRHSTQQSQAPCEDGWFSAALALVTPRLHGWGPMQTILLILSHA